MLQIKYCCYGVVCWGHRRRINTEEKAKVVAAVWGTEFLQFLAALAVFHYDDVKNKMYILQQNDLKKIMNSSYIILQNRPSAKYLACQGI